MHSSTRLTIFSGRWFLIDLSWTVSTTGKLLLTHELNMSSRSGSPLSKSSALRMPSVTTILVLASMALDSWDMGATPRVASTASHSRKRASWGCSSTWIMALCHSLWMANSLDWPFRTRLWREAPSGQLSHFYTPEAAHWYLVCRNQQISCERAWLMLS